jgi:methionyl-tRNA formyltransferase
MGPTEPVNVVLLGKGSLGVRIANWFLHDPQWHLACIVPVVPEPTWTESLAGFARQSGVPTVSSGLYHDVPDHVRIDLAFSIFYDKIFDRRFLARCQRILNLHSGPLPRYRGMRPVNWALKNQEQTHGVTIHEVTAEIDAGPILAQTTYSIYPEFEEVQEVYNRSLEFAWVTFQQTMPLIKRIKPRPQASAQATYYSARDAVRLGDRLNPFRA